MIERRWVRKTEIAAWRNVAPWAERKTLVFIPGSGGDHTLWLPVLNELKDDFNLLALELPGHGSSGGKGEEEVGAYVEWVKDILDVFEVRKPVLVGHSLGAAITLTTALRYPELLAGVVAVGGGARMPVNTMILDAIHKDLKGLMAFTSKIAVAKKNRERLIPVLTARSPNPDTLYGDFKACDRLDLEEDLGKITVPTLIVCGMEDKMTPPELSQAMQTKIPNSQLVLLPETGHMVMLEEPHRLAEILGSFVRSIK
ncbi:MAG: alpha/beta hydrolase [Syntrophales bacterium]|nr:alpha/beta hydrolase [Syntrophales bacterium]